MRLAHSLLAAALFSAGCSHPALPVYQTVPAFRLTDQEGKSFSSAGRLSGKVWIADFIYTNCPGPCPRMTSVMHRLQQDLDTASNAENIRFVSFSVDPARDSPQVLSEYAKRFGAPAARWFFLTGDQTTLQKLDRYAFLLGDVDGKLEHSTKFVLVDWQGRIRGYYDSLDAEAIQKLRRDAEELARKAS